MRRPGRRARVLLALPLAYLALLVDWRGASPAVPSVRTAFATNAPLQAGAARVRLNPPLPVVRGGYGLRRAVAVREKDPLEVRALVVRAGGKSVAVVLADVVLIPDAIAEELRRRLHGRGFDGVLVAATHTHSSIGAFDERLLAQFVGMGRYRADVAAALLDRMEEAALKAAAHVVPVHIKTAAGRLAGWAENRSTPGGAVDDALTVVVLAAESGEAVAHVAIAAAHATLFPRTSPELSADYPGVAMRTLEEHGPTTLLLQGAEGDARPHGWGDAAIQKAGREVAERISETLRSTTSAPDRLAFADVEIRLPKPELQMARSFFLRRPLSNILQALAPRTSHIAALTLGDVTLLALPGEPTALAATEIVARLTRADRKPRVVALSQGYIGYIDIAERVARGTGEGWRSWFAPELIDTMVVGANAAVQF